MLREVFTKIKKSHGITGKAISQKTGISQKHISEYINGKRDVTSEALWRMVEAMDQLSPGALRDFGLRLTGLGGSLTTLVEQMPPEELSDTLFAIAASLRKSRYREVDQEEESIAVA